MEINSQTKLTGLLGNPVSHSISPAFQNAAFKHLKMNWVYLPFLVNDSDDEKYVKSAVLGLRGLGFAGANVTVPHKQKVMPWLFKLTDSAKAIGAVNTIIIDKSGTLLGDNTDAIGFIADLKEKNIDLANSSAAILGAGGSARAVIYALGISKAAKITLIARNFKKAKALTSQMKNLFPDVLLSYSKDEKDIENTIKSCDMLVNCTPLGMKSTTSSSLETLDMWKRLFKFNKNQVVYDLIYNPQKTALMKLCENKVSKAYNGLGMLVHQGARSFEMWTGKKAPLDVMHRAAIDALNKNKRQKC